MVRGLSDTITFSLVSAFGVQLFWHCWNICRLSSGGETSADLIRGAYGYKIKMWNHEVVIGKQKYCGFSQKWKGKKNNNPFFLAEIESQIRFSTENASYV